MKEYSYILVALLKGIVYRQEANLWSYLLQYEPDVKKYFKNIFLDLVINESEGFAYLKQYRSEDDSEDVPKLISKRPLSAQVSLLCLILRKELIANDTEGRSSQAYITRQVMINEITAFYPDKTDEAKQLEKMKATIKKVVEEGFLRKLQHDDDTYQIMSILKAFIPAEVVSEKLVEIKKHLSQYQNHE